MPPKGSSNFWPLCLWKQGCSSSEAGSTDGEFAVHSAHRGFAFWLVQEIYFVVNPKTAKGALCPKLPDLLTKSAVLLMERPGTATLSSKSSKASMPRLQPHIRSRMRT